MKKSSIFILILGCFYFAQGQDRYAIDETPLIDEYEDDDDSGGGGTCSPRIKYYRDHDRDGLGDPNDYIEICAGATKPSGFVLNNKDCNDRNELVKEGYRYYPDKDGDGFGTKNVIPIRSCEELEDLNYEKIIWSDNNLDCDDNDKLVFPKRWYIDRDGDGRGDDNTPYVFQCYAPSDKYILKSGDCDDNNPLAFGCPNYNTIQTTDYNVEGSIIGQSKSYYNVLGPMILAQTKDFKTNAIWETRTLYDYQGRAAVQTLSAPTNTRFIYNEKNIQKTDGQLFTAIDFETNPEDPAIVGNQSNTLGWYYSDKNTSEPYQDATSRPYSRTIYSELNPGAVLKTIGGNKIDGQWKNGYSFTMPAGQELSQSVAFGNTKYNTIQTLKTVTRDVHGVETIVFTDTDGNTLAAARSGNEAGGTTIRSSQVKIGAQGFVDIHLPVGTSGITLSGHSGIALDVYNLMTEQKVSTAVGSLPHGVYRIAVRNVATYTPDRITVTYKENYYDYSLNEFDKAGRLVASYQPLQKLKSTYTYNALGQLEHTQSPDEGHAWFLYREDGQIRFSMNSKQWQANEFSYTNYDDRGRPVESGVFINATTYLNTVPTTITATATPFTSALQNIVDIVNGDGLADANCQEQHFTKYDSADTDGLAAAFGSDSRKSSYTQQQFVASNVAKTYTQNPATTTTWYSYDIYGRVTWIAQQIEGLSGIKTIDYTYDAVTGQVTQVYYQKGHTTEAFMHRYTYDPVDYSLTKVETSTDGNTYTEHAAYSYYETGALKRVNLAEGLQGIDYVYNLEGALKSINHPSLEEANDPGGDANDLFGMMIDYHDYDYNRPQRNIKSASYGVNQYNGNIKGIRWNSEYRKTANQEHIYQYEYTKNNWLSKANYGHFNGDYASLPTITEATEREKGTAKDNDLSANYSISSGSTRHFLANNSITFKPGFHAHSGSVVTAKIDGKPATNAIRSINAGTFVANGNEDYTVKGLTYDANGNIQSLHRNKHTENGSNDMDQLSYTYKTDKPNQLLRVDDAVTSTTNTQDIKDQNGNNYIYNSIGQLIENREEEITYIYNTSGLVIEIQKNTVPLVKFFYNDKGHRVRKESYNFDNGNLVYTEHYVRDAAGTAMAIYRDGNAIEHTIYGSNRLGVFKRQSGTSLYQLTDHLGNVRAVIGRAANGQALAMTSATDYYPGGMAMPNRNLKGDYRYAYQGEFAETDPETGKPAFELRLYDPRINRWLTPDPYGEFHSPYMAMGNNWPSTVDPSGGCTDCSKCPDACGQLGIDAIPDGQSVDFNFDSGAFSLINGASSLLNEVNLGTSHTVRLEGYLGQARFWMRPDDTVGDYWDRKNDAERRIRAGNEIWLWGAMNVLTLGNAPKMPTRTTPRTYSPRITTSSSGYSIDPKKYDYFFGRVTTGREHSIIRSAQNARDLEKLGITNKSQLKKIFDEAFVNGSTQNTMKNIHGTTVIKRIQVNNNGAIDVNFFYPKGGGKPRISTLIPKIFN